MNEQLNNIYNILWVIAVCQLVQLGMALFDAVNK